jgi:predicted RNA-binding Zn ribbon-like protein
MRRLMPSTESAPLSTPEPGGRLPAPPELRLVQVFVNTNDVLAGTDELGSPAALATWLSDQRLAPAGLAVSSAEFVHAIRVREAVRMFLSRDRGQPSELEIGLLDDVGRRARLQWAFEADGSVRLKAGTPGVIGALGTILAPLLSAALTGSLVRLKTCRNCRWVFYDYSKNRSGTWCAMALCGSRAKAKRHYRRMREQTSTDAPPSAPSRSGG